MKDQKELIYNLRLEAQNHSDFYPSDSFFIQMLKDAADALMQHNGFSEDMIRKISEDRLPFRGYGNKND